MLTDVLSADKDEEVSRGEDEDRQVRHCVLAKALNLFLSNFIPADRCLAGQNIRVTGERGGQREGGNEDDLQGGDQRRSRCSSPAYPLALPPPLIWKR